MYKGPETTYFSQWCISTSAWREALFCATSSRKPSWTIQAAGIAAPGLPAAHPCTQHCSSYYRSCEMIIV